MAGRSSSQQQTDVLIVGAGPAGLMAAITLARYGIDFKIVDKSPVRVAAGHASAFQPRTQEILQTLNLLHELDQRGHRHTNTAFWQEDGDGLIKRTSRSCEVVHRTPYPHVFNTDQGICESVLGEELARRGHVIDRPYELVDFEYTDGSYTNGTRPIRAHFLNVGSQAIETWEVGYILGADGARSSTRGSAGFSASCQGGEHVWAVADVFVKTDFPDHRCRVVIRTKKGGCMLIPRKDDGVRVFTQMTDEDLETLQQLDRSRARNVSESKAAKMLRYIQDQLSTVLQPYSMEITDVLWQSHYKVRQRLLNKFSDDRGRVFLLGDACHTHSPKAGQGLNISVQDSYNLTWKIALVIKGLAKADLLQTYEIERRHIAQQLIDFDVKFAGAFAGAGGADAAVMKHLWNQHRGFTSGLQHCYPENSLVWCSEPSLASTIDGGAVDPVTPGKRLLPARQLLRSIDGNAVDLLDEMPSNGRFHVFVFAGNCQVAYTPYSKSLMNLVHRVNNRPSGSFMPEDITHMDARCNRDYLVDIFVIHTQEPGDDFLFNGLLPAARSWGFAGRVYGDQDAVYHREIGISTTQGAIVLVRPDGYVGMVSSLDIGGVHRLEKYLGGVFVL